MGFAADAGWLARRAAATMRLGVSLGSAGTPGLAALQDAATHLVAGDAVAAEAALAKLSDATMSALGPWRAGLARRIAADAALTRLAALNVTRTRDLTP